MVNEGLDQEFVFCRVTFKEKRERIVEFHLMTVKKEE
jgi:hypothetical protein